MTELERREAHDAEIAAWHALVGDAYRAARDAGPHVPSVWTPANDDQIPAANDNNELDEAA
jgi:hypothetical protein